MDITKNASGKLSVKLSHSEWLDIGSQKKWVVTASNKEDSSVFLALLELQNNLKIFHWQTSSFAQHQAFGKIYDELSDLIDDFVELSIGRHGQFKLPEKAMQLQNIKGFKQCVSDGLLFLEGLALKEEIDLGNIRDEMVGRLNKLQFLLTLD
jgi:hypothetical protein